MAIGRTVLVVLLLGGGVGLAGCASLGSDFGAAWEEALPPSPSEAARMAINPHDPDDRREGTTLLANAPFGGEDTYVALYRDYVENERDPLVLASAIRGLARFGETTDAPLIAAHFEDESPVVRWEVAKAMQRLHDPEVVPAILKALLDDEDSSVRLACARALAQYPEDRVFQGLVGALDQRELSVNRAAAESLTTLTGYDGGLDSRVWLQWHDALPDSSLAFVDQREFVYPTYERDIKWHEKVVFWSKPVFEAPQVPVGLRPDSERSTYDDAEDEDQSGEPMMEPDGARRTYEDDGGVR